MEYSLLLKQWPDITAYERYLSNSLGIIKVKTLHGQAHQAQVLAVGYYHYTVDIRCSGEASNYSWVLQPKFQLLSQINVIARCPLITQEEDKLLINPKNLASRSANAFI